MRLSRPVAIVLIVAASVQPIYFVCYGVLMCWITFGDPTLDQRMLGYQAFMIGLVAEVFWTWVLSAIYLFCLFKADTVPADHKPIWAVAMLMANFPAMAVFWYLYIWRNPTPKTPVAESESGVRELTPSI